MAARNDVQPTLDVDNGAEAHANKRQTSLDPPDAKRMACGSPGTAIHVTAAAPTVAAGPTAAGPVTEKEASTAKQQQQQVQQDTDSHHRQDAKAASTPSSSSHAAGSMGPPASRRSQSPLSHQVVTTGLQHMEPSVACTDKTSPVAAAAAAASPRGRPRSPFAAGAYAPAPEGEDAGGPAQGQAVPGPLFSPFVAATAAAAAAKQQGPHCPAPGSSPTTAGPEQQQQQQDRVFQPPLSARTAAGAAPAGRSPGLSTAADVWAQIAGAKGAPGPPPASSSGARGSGSSSGVPGSHGVSPFLQGAGALQVPDRTGPQQAMDRMHSSASLECWLQPSGSLATPLPGAGSSGGAQGSLLSYPSISSGGISAAVPVPGGAAAGGDGGSSAALEGQLSTSSGSGPLARGSSVAASGLERSFSLSRWIRPRDPSGSFSWPTPLVARSLSAEDMDMEVQVLPAVTPEQYPTPDPRELSGEGGTTPTAAAAAAAGGHAGQGAAAAGSSPALERQYFRKISGWEEELVDMLGPQVDYAPQSIKAIVGVFRERIRCERDKNEFKALCDKWTFVTEHPPGSGVKCLAIKAWLRQGQDQGQEGSD